MSASLIDWSVAGRPLPGELVSGDLHVAEFFPGGALLAAIDGLGHGPAAEAAARTAADVLRVDPRRPVEELVRACHDALGRMRGVVMSLASFDAASARMTWLGVGNVESIHLRREGLALVRDRLFVRGGIVGQAIGSLRAATVPIAQGDVLVFATDGLDSGFLDERFLEQVRLEIAVETIATEVLERHAQARDDALVLVARYRGDAS
jgi:serine phosphatase RsbU (regulator of sigma subunit)